MFEALGEKFDSVFRTIRGQGVITEKNVRDVMKDVRLALLEADVNFKVVKGFTSSVQEKALGQDVLRSVTPGQQFVKIVHDELVEMMGGTAAHFELKQDKTNVVLLLGLQGSGKTTFAGKLARMYLSKGWAPMLVACDVKRPAAIKQVSLIGRQVGVPTFDMGDRKSPSVIAKRALSAALKDSRNLVIVDTAGRLHIADDLIKEMIDIKKAIEPDYTFLVADATTGQDAVNSASSFNEKIGIDGVCLTKLDGDARGGAALSIKAVTGKPIYFAGVGEKPEDLELFHPDRMGSRILGMGDVLTLVDKAQEVFDEKQAQALQKKIRRAAFTFQDFLDQMRQVKKMGSLKDLVGMIPGVGKQLKNVDIDEAQFGRMEAAILSMTPYEREHPDTIDGGRRHRIADGSGNSIQEINQFLKQFDEAKRMMKQFMSGSGDGAGLMGGRFSGHGGKKKKKKKKKKKR